MPGTGAGPPGILGDRMLTDAQIRKAKAATRPYKLTDGGGLHLYVTPAGGKLWRLRYEFERKEKLLSIGPYSVVGLADARAAATDAKRLLREGRDPAVEKRLRRLGVITDGRTTFEAIAREWHELNKGHWVEVHANDVLHSLERDVFPDLGATPIKDITPTNVLSVLRKIEDRSAVETARRIRQRMSAVFVYAIASGRAETDPAAIVQKAMKPVKTGRQPAITDLEQAREILRRADATPASPVTKLALRLLALTSLRPGTLITTPWTELDVLDPEAPVWQVPATRMKLRLQYKDDETRDHLVPSSIPSFSGILSNKRIKRAENLSEKNRNPPIDGEDRHEQPGRVEYWLTV
jgi:Arm DNA-binding domain